MTSLNSVSVSCTAISATILQKAQLQAKKLNLPYCAPGACRSPYVLIYTDECLELRCLAEKQKFNPLFVDFLKGGTAYRHAHNCTIQQPLARAIGIRPGFRPDVFDATAGLGGDAFVLACLGCRVTLNERSPIIHALLEDGLNRAAADPVTADIVNTRMRLLMGEAAANLSALAPVPYTIYLDPMYPHSDKSALNKKEMRMIRDIVGNDEDSGELLEYSLTFATDRVVVKRPKRAALLNSRVPNHEIIMKNSRFDVYLVNR